jgi:hypothetical protein
VVCGVWCVVCVCGLAHVFPGAIILCKMANDFVELLRRGDEMFLESWVINEENLEETLLHLSLFHSTFLSISETQRKVRQNLVKRTYDETGNY